MSLKKIIREEMDDLQWIRDVKVNPWDGIEFKVSADKTLKTTYKILDWGDPKGVRVIWRDNDDYRNKWKHTHYTREEVENYVNKGNWVIVNKNMTESEDDLQWIRDIEPNPKKPEKGFIYKFYNYSNSIYGEYIKTDDIIITHVTGDHVYFDTVNRYWANHPMDPGSDGIDKIAFNRLVNAGDIKYIGPKNINESDDLDWIRDVTHQLPMDRDWWLINDVDPNSLEVSREIQDFLFNQGFMWLSGKKEFAPYEFSAISHRGGTYERQEGLFGYYPISEHTTKEMEEYESENGEIYYWSQLKSDSLNESNDLDWIKDIEAGDLWTPYVGMKFIVTDGSDDDIYHILDINDEEGWMELKWENNKTGEGDYFGYYMEDYYRMVGEDRVQIVHDKLNESEGDLDWIKNINPIPELKVGSCFVDVMDPTQRKWVITHFKMTPAGTRLVVVKNNEKIFVNDTSLGSEDIKYMHEEYFEQDLFNGRYKPCQR